MAAFHAALDDERRRRGISWRQVAAEASVNTSTLTRMAQGKRPDVDGMAALASWSGLSLDPFIRTSRRARERPDTISVLSSQFHTDPSLSVADANTLVDLLRVAYERLRQDRVTAKSEPATTRSGPRRTRRALS